MAEQHAQAWIVEHLYDVSERPVVSRRGVTTWRGRLYARDIEGVTYAWALLNYLTGRRKREPKASRRTSGERIRDAIKRELAR